MVGQVSQLSAMNQLLRRGKRKGWAEYGPQHFQVGDTGATKGGHFPYILPIEPISVSHM